MAQNTIHLLCIFLTITINGFAACAPLEEFCEGYGEDSKSQVLDFSPKSCTLDACDKATLDQLPKWGIVYDTTCLGPACIACISIKEMSSNDGTLFDAVVSAIKDYVRGWVSIFEGQE